MPRWTFSSSPMCRVTVLPLSESETLVVPVGAAERVTLATGADEGEGVTRVPGPLEADPATPAGEGVPAGVGLGAGAGVGNDRELEGAVKV